MRYDNCGDVRDLLPLHAAGALEADQHEAIEAHVAGCEECAAELGLIRTLRMTVPAPDAALVDRVQESVRAEAGRRGYGRVWRLAAAATVVLALGTAALWQQVQQDPGAIGAQANSLGAVIDDDGWPDDQTQIAGHVVWDDLTDDEMLALLEDWDDEA